MNVRRRVRRFSVPRLRVLDDSVGNVAECIVKKVYFVLDPHQLRDTWGKVSVTTVAKTEFNGFGRTLLSFSAAFLPDVDIPHELLDAVVFLSGNLERSIVLRLQRLKLRLQLQCFVLNLQSMLLLERMGASD